MIYFLKLKTAILLRKIAAPVILLGLISAANVQGATVIMISATLTDSMGRSVHAHTYLTILDQPPAITLSEAKSCPDGTMVRVEELVASSSSSHFAGLFYAQNIDRTSGIGILWDQAIDCGDKIAVFGGITTRDGERFIQAEDVEVDL